MTSNQTVSFDPQWEQVRLTLANLSRDFYTPKLTTVFHPGDIASCRGSIEKAFYGNLMDLGFRLTYGERKSQARVAPPPLRFCLVNRHIEGQLYEVFLLTTFGGARHISILDDVARYFAMPMGYTQWTEDIPGVKTIPPMFGQQTTSFLFALPAIRSVIPCQVRARVPARELQRVAEFARAKRQARFQA
ncbi:hypothetical protein BDZ97DRAFT_1812619 [Flammula alnicola]|nr:hypothetical protein BDZ97DRAFT_1812619 [Flammula alnicola]